jgi:hypothetical protein
VGDRWANDKNGFVLTAQPGESQGRPKRFCRDHDLRELAMHVQTDASPTHHFTSIHTSVDDVGARRANDTYGSALKAHPGKSQGRPSTNPRSKRNV